MLSNCWRGILKGSPTYAERTAADNPRQNKTYHPDAPFVALFMQPLVEQIQNQIIQPECRCHAK